MCASSMYRYPALEEPEPSPESPTDETEKSDPPQSVTEDDDSDSRVIVVDAPSQSPTELYAAAARALAEAQNAFSAAISAPQANLISKEEAAAQTKALEGDILTLKELLRQQQLRAEMLEDALNDLKHENEALRRELGRGEVEELRNENERLARERDGLRDTLVRLRTGMDGLGESSYERERGLRDRDKIGEEQQALIKKFVENVTVLQKRYEDAEKEVMVREPKLIDSFNYMDHLLSSSRLSRESISPAPNVPLRTRDEDPIPPADYSARRRSHSTEFALPQRAASSSSSEHASRTQLSRNAGEDAFSMTQDQDTYSVRAAKRPRSVNPYSEYYSTRFTASPIASSYSPLPEDFCLPPKTPPPPTHSASSIAPQRATASVSGPAPAKRIRTSDPPTQHPVASTSTSTPRLTTAPTPTSSAKPKPRIPSGMRAFGYKETESGDLLYSGGGRKRKKT